MRPPQRGYILPTTAILLIPLMLFAALAVDFGAWTVQAGQLQNAADAAALAGAPYLPRLDDAREAAEEAAAANGFTQGVTISFPNDLTIEVSVAADAQTYFSSFALDTFPITRTAGATAVAPITMGSPTNVLGHGPHELGNGIGASQYFIGFNGECQLGHYGDIGAATYLTNSRCGTENGLNPYRRLNNAGTLERRSAGHFLIVEMPPGAQPSALWVFDPGSECTGWAYGGAVIKPADQGYTEISWQQWHDNNTVANQADDYPIGAPWSSDDCGYDIEFAETGGASHSDWTRGWSRTPFEFPANNSSEIRRYLIEPIARNGRGNTAEGFNYHSYWVRPHGSTRACSTIRDETCPTIGAESWLVAAARGPSAPVNETSSTIDRSMDLYLAEISPRHQSKNLEVLLWDPGEGMDNIQILDPYGKPVNFTWTSNHPDDASQAHPTETCTAGPDRPAWPAQYQGQPAPCLKVYETRSPRFPSWGRQRWRFDGTVVRVSIPLTVENGIDLASYSNSWFSLRFMPRAGGELREWASFSVQVTGDPIRLSQ